MPKGPRGQKAPADVIGAAIMTARIATGEIEESLPIALKCALSPDAKPYVASHHQPRTAFESDNGRSAFASGNRSSCPRPFSNRGARVKLGVKLAFAGVMVLSGVGCPPHDGCQGCDAARWKAI